MTDFEKGDEVRHPREGNAILTVVAPADRNGVLVTEYFNSDTRQNIAVTADVSEFILVKKA